MNRIKKNYVLLLAAVLTLCASLIGAGVVFAEEAAAEPIDYIYFDLAAGDVNIGGATYSGWVYVRGTAREVSGTHSDSNKYYIYQSTETNRATTGYVTETDWDNKTCKVPSYSRVTYDGKEWAKYITNNTNVKAVSENWETAAKAVDRRPLGEQAKNNAAASGNRIIFDNASEYEADVTIDNIWTYYQTYGNNRNTGGITAHLKGSTDTKIYIRLKGDNRLGNIHYGAYENSRNQIIFSNGEAANKTPGSITVADFPEDLGKNHWASAIGGDDADCDRSDGIVIDGGVIYAGTTAADNCTALGGGGNEYGRVTINNGTVTAVAATTGTAIGGGIGWGGAGGNADVTINKGEVYAYNFGVDNSSSDKFEHYVPAVAIGGGSSQGSAGNARTTVTINGGFVYAQCMGGAAIGGGGSASSSGGGATIIIKGGTIIAKSTSGTFKGTKDPDVVNIPAGVSIGGGTGKTAGGSVILNISGGTLRTGSIGGGLATGTDADGNPAKIGNATVTVSGGNIIGQVIMAGGANKPCSFTMTDGVIHSTDVTRELTIAETNVQGGVTVTDPQPDVPLSFIEKDGGAVWMDDSQGVTTITGGLIGNCTANNGGAVYMTGGTFILSGTGELGTNHAEESGGSVYVGGGTVQIGGGVKLEDGTVLVEENSADASKCAIRNSDAAKNGGGVYVGDGTVDIKGGSIRVNTAEENGGGMYVGNGNITLSGKMSPKAVEVKEEDGNKYFTISTTSIKRNKANLNGGGMFVENGNITIKSGEINYNESVNGAGMYVGNGTVTMSNGSIHDNTATKSGGGMFVSSTESSGTKDNVTITGGSVKFNKATESGGGMFVNQGNITINKVDSSENANPVISTEISNNTATQDGGGVFVTGDVYMLNGSVTKNRAENGGGFCVEDGTVLMYGGSIDNNTAAENGGGMHVSANSKEPIVDIFSGSISNNNAKNGGGVSVVSAGGAKPIHVTVGVNCVHPDLNCDTRNYTAFDYPGESGGCGEAHTDHTHNHIGEVGKHSSCPVIKNNIAEKSGGGFYLSSPKTSLVFYCIIEDDNKANGSDQCYNMDVEGGSVEIGDKTYDYTKNDPVKGNIVMQSSILVKGGTVDIYGKMDNPEFTDDVTVDITQNTDHYIDHRLMNQDPLQFYKVHYYENFKGDGDTPTGLYIARQYPDLDHDHSQDDERFDFTIMSSIFSHPGYKIVGWNSQPDDKGTKFEVNETYNFKTSPEVTINLGADIQHNGSTVLDKSLLVIYAIWERCGYVLKFDPNVGEGETYTGTMEDQRVTVGLFDGSQKIKQNQFKRPGYRFVGWTLVRTPGDTDKTYTDGQTITADFTDKDGETVTLYAQWERCTHVDYLVYTADGNVMTESCSACGGHTATATVSAVNAVYDGNTHLASVSFSTNWLGDPKPEITYEMAASEWDDKDTADEEWTTNPQPIHAGSYTAKLTVENKIYDDESKKYATAQIAYTISPVKWEKPAVPQISFKVVKVGATYNSIITITTPIGDNLMYKITHLPNGGVETGVDGYPDWQSTKEFANIPYGKYYYFYAKVSADRDHEESDPSKSSAYLATGGNIVYIENGEGIKVVPTYGTGHFEYTVSADEGYHLRGYDDNLTGDLMEIDPQNLPGFIKPIPGVEDGDALIQEGGITIKRDKNADGTYTYTVTLVEGKVAYHQITLKFSGAAKNASVAHKVTDGEVFADFNGKDTTISRDSAFTVQFTVSDYIPDEYVKQALTFSRSLPKDTTIILKVGGGYWYYNLAAAADKINLTDFIAMGGTQKFSFDTSGTAATSFTYQFIVDFSKTTEGRITADSLNVSLELTAKTGNTSEKAPDVSGTASVGIKKEAEFSLTASADGKTATLDCNYTTSPGAASIWGGRETALVLTAPETAPADLTLTAVVGGNTTRYPMNSSRQFIIPLDGIGTKEVKITLNSNLFSSSEESLVFNAEWYVSKSGAGKSPINGYRASSCEVSFSCKKDTVPSVRIEGDTHLCHAGGKLRVTVSYAGIPADGTVTAYLQGKNGGQYVDTGAKASITIDESMEASIEFSMGQMANGSYRILVIVQESGANILLVPYYFVIV